MTPEARELAYVRAERDELAHRLHCYRAAAEMLADVLELDRVPRDEVVAQLRALGTHIGLTVAGEYATSPLPHTSAATEAGERSEPAAGAEGSRSAQPNAGTAASTPAPSESPRDTAEAAAPRTRPQRIVAALEAVVGRGF